MRLFTNRQNGHSSSNRRGNVVPFVIAALQAGNEHCMRIIITGLQTMRRSG
jgi:hypothetical protein